MNAVIWFAFVVTMAHGSNPPLDIAARPRTLAACLAYIHKAERREPAYAWCGAQVRDKTFIVSKREGTPV